jgi:DNA polymerase delta subunit 1
MSPIKRVLSESKDPLPLKRLRGGGDDDDEDLPVEEELFDDDQMIDQEMDYQEPPEEEEDVAALQELKKNEVASRWERPALPTDFSNATNLNVQWLDMDFFTGNPLDRNPNLTRHKVVGSATGKVPVLRAYGVNEAGYSVAIYVHGFTPYAFFALPPGYELTDSSKLGDIRSKLEDNLKMAVRGNQADSAAVFGVEYLTTHKSIMGYETQHTKFLKVFVSLPGLVPTLKNILEGGISLPGIQCTNVALDENGGLGSPSYAPFECNVPFVLRFMVDRDISGAGWLSLPKQTYQIRDAAKKETHCQVRCFMGFLMLYISLFLTRFTLFDRSKWISPTMT